MAIQDKYQKTFAGDVKSREAKVAELKKQKLQRLRDPALEKFFLNHHAGYCKYTQSKHWANLREQRLELDGWKCQVCGSKDNLQVHHTSYKHLYEPDEILDTMTLCKHCHHKIEAIKKLSVTDGILNVYMPANIYFLLYDALTGLMAYSEKHLRDFISDWIIFHLEDVTEWLLIYEEKFNLLANTPDNLNTNWECLL